MSHSTNGAKVQTKAKAVAARSLNNRPANRRTPQHHPILLPAGANWILLGPDLPAGEPAGSPVLALRSGRVLYLRHLLRLLHLLCLPLFTAILPPPPPHRGSLPLLSSPGIANTSHGS